MKSVKFIKMVSLFFTALFIFAVLTVTSVAAIGLTEDGHLAGLTTGKTYTATPYDIIAGTADTAQTDCVVKKLTPLAPKLKYNVNSANNIQGIRYNRSGLRG